MDTEKTQKDSVKFCGYEVFLKIGMKSLSIFLIKIYQFFAGPFPKQCRFYPSCSVYAVESLEKFGFFKGWFLAIRRLLKCGPWHPGGFDPVP